MYPKSFQDIIGGKPFGNGYASLLHSMVIRFDNLNRTKKNSLKLKLPTQTNKARKRCINFQPDNLPPKETEKTQTERQIWLQNHYKKKEQLAETVQEMMEITYASQRFTINSILPIDQIIKDWPYLAEEKYLLHHFNMAMSPYCPDWDAIFVSKVPDLFAYLTSKVEEEVDGCTIITVLQLLCSYFKEDNIIVKIYRECDSIVDVNKDECPVTPFIAVFGSSSAVVFIEKIEFSKYVLPNEAFKMWFTSFFVFNLMYPESCQATMEFIQKGLMGMPQSSTTTNKHAYKKSLKLVKELCMFRNQWTV